MEAISRVSVLSVDDLSANLLAMRALLEPLGVDVHDAESGETALALAARVEFAVALVDVMMPGIDGFETLARLRANPKSAGTPVILITAGDMDMSVVERAYTLGAVDWITKPIAGAILRGKVRAFISLYEANKQLRDRDAALAARNRHIAILAHDLGNPLSTIAMGSHLLKDQGLSPRALEVTDRIARAASRMQAMIADLLDHARIEAGTLTVERQPFDLRQLCTELVEEFRLADPARRIDLEVSGDLNGLWDAPRLYQALSNLMGNAIRYGRGLARLSADGRGEQVEIMVHNDGPQIPPDLLPVIFEPFSRGPNRNPGLGLGLYIVREIVRAHGGEVTVRSSAEDGTTFESRLPRSPS